MAWYEDSTPYRYGGGDERNALNVGWLESPHPFPTGDIAPDFIRKLVQLCVERRMNATRGFHVCPLCPPPVLEEGRVDPFWPVRIEYQGAMRYLGDTEIRVRHPSGTVFASPNMVAHYVVEHRYLPPQAFIDAVLADPRTQIEENTDQAQLPH